MRRLKSSNISVLITVVLILAIAAALLYIFLPAKSNPLNPYYGWRTYCSNTTNICFKYPSNWKTVKYPADESGIVTFESSNNSEQVSYENSDICLANVTYGTIYVNSIENLKTNPRVSVVGVTLNNVPEYTLINTDDLNLHDLPPLHKLTQGNTNICPSFKDSWIEATPNNTSYSLNSAKAWFNSTDAKNALLSLKSITFKS